MESGGGEESGSVAESGFYGSSEHGARVVSSESDSDDSVVGDLVSYESGAAGSQLLPEGQIVSAEPTQVVQPRGLQYGLSKWFGTASQKE